MPPGRHGTRSSRVGGRCGSVPPRRSRSASRGRSRLARGRGDVAADLPRRGRRGRAFWRHPAGARRIGTDPRCGADHRRGPRSWCDGGWARICLALTLITPPGEQGADVRFGTTQRFCVVPMGFGGRTPATCRCTPRMPGRCPTPGGCPSVDADGRWPTGWRCRPVSSTSAGEGHVQHLHGASPARDRGVDVRRLPRTRGPANHRPTHRMARRLAAAALAPVGIGRGTVLRHHPGRPVTAVAVEAAARAGAMSTFESAPSVTWSRRR